MRVLVDTCVWSLALRRETASNHRWVSELRSLVTDHRVDIIGPIRQELLSGIQNPRQFDALKKNLDAFPDLPIITDDYVEAAQMYNRCRSHGIQGSNTDFLICAVALRYACSIFTEDRDFSFFARHLPITLHKL